MRIRPGARFRNLGRWAAFSAGCAVAAIDPTPRKALQCERHEDVFTMTLAHGTDRLESAHIVLRRIAPDDLPFFTRIHALPRSRAVSLSRRPAALARRVGRMVAGHSREL